MDLGPLARFGDDAKQQFRWEFQSWMVSQFMHGEFLLEQVWERMEVPVEEGKATP